MAESPEPPSRRGSSIATPLPRSTARGFLAGLLAEAAPIDLQILGRTLLHAALVGAAAGLVGVFFFAGLEAVEAVLLERLGGYVPLRAFGEHVVDLGHGVVTRPWLILVLPAIGGVLTGLLTSKIAPETAGGGGDAMIDAFHHQNAIIRKRVPWVKTLASFLTLGTGGSGGREGPTMQIGGAIGSLVARSLRVSDRERRVLLIAGVAAGMSAVFRTPLGAALLATEVLYRDDFESEALIPAVLASVVSYSVAISFFGESTLFAHSARFPFVMAHLPLYGVLAILLAVVATVFVKTLRTVQGLTSRLPVPLWVRPGLGGLALGMFVVPILYVVDRKISAPGQGLGLLGGGYGAAQVAITTAAWLPSGWTGVEVLLLMCAAKLVASSLTIGSGGSAGDFAPSLVLGGLFGGAFGRALELLMHDPRIDPGAFALVGMGTLYGGIAHVPLSSLVLTCELAGSYDLLVPLMLAEGVAFVVLRRQSLYHAQLTSHVDSPAHRDALPDVLRSVRVRDIMIQGRPFLSFEVKTPARELVDRAVDATWQDVFPVLDATGKMVGMVTTEMLRILASERELEPFALAADAMQPPATVALGDDLRAATAVMLAHSVREVPVVDADGKIVGFLDESDVGKAYLDATLPQRDGDSPRSSKRR